MAISVFELFTIGIGPSSSHTVGPMRAARLFLELLSNSGRLVRTSRVKAELFGSLGLTGRGHGSDKAVLLGLEGERPETVEVGAIPERLERIRSACEIALGGTHAIPFDEAEDLVLHKRRKLPGHPNGMRFTAYAGDAVLAEAVYYSIGGGFVIDEQADELRPDDTRQPYPFDTAAALLAHCETAGCRISDVMLANEEVWRSQTEIRDGLLTIWRAMQDCVAAGCATDGEMPGLRVRRRAADLERKLSADAAAGDADPLNVLDWVNLFALAVNEENAAGGRVVTAPTNGAAGIIPAVLHYFVRFCGGDGDDDAIVRFLLTAGAIGILFKQNASISGAEVGCQGEVGSACAMAAGALAEVLGGTPAQVENAAEIGMEHNLGLTCDPIKGLVQIPCIERNAMASVKAINAARLALRGDGRHVVSLDRVIKTMRETGRDMKDKYKETARGGLAVNALPVSVNLPEC